MELDQIRTFVSLAEGRNFTRTAQELHVVQSAVSMRLRSLESSLGKTLIRRSPRRVELTPAGRLFLPYAQRLLRLAGESQELLRGDGVFADHVVVGSTDSLWRHQLRSRLIDFCRQNPRTSVATKTGHSREVIEMLWDGIIHLGLVYVRPQIAGICAVPFFTDELILVAHRNHPVAKKRRLKREELGRVPFITIEWDGPIHDWIRKLMPRDYHPQLSLDQLSTLKHLIRCGEGVGFLPRTTVHEELKSGELVALPIVGLKPLRRKGYAIYRREKQIRPAILAWLRLLGVTPARAR